MSWVPPKRTYTSKQGAKIYVLSDRSCFLVPVFRWMPGQTITRSEAAQMLISARRNGHIHKRETHA